MLRFDVINRVLFNHRILFLEPLAAQSLCCFIMTNRNHKKIAPCGVIKVFWIELKNYSMLRFDIINRVLFNHRILFLERWQSLCCFIMTNYSMLCFVIINSVLFNPLCVWISHTVGLCRMSRFLDLKKQATTLDMGLWPTRTARGVSDGMKNEARQSKWPINHPWRSVYHETVDLEGEKWKAMGGRDRRRDSIITDKLSVLEPYKWE